VLSGLTSVCLLTHTADMDGEGQACSTSTEIGVKQPPLAHVYCTVKLPETAGDICVTELPVELL
jgi:hypothetical protein